MGQSPPTPRTHHVARTYSFPRSVLLLLEFHSVPVSRSPPLLPLPLFFRRLVILQFHVLPYGNIVIFPPASPPPSLPPPPPPLRRAGAFLRATARAPLVSAHLDSRPARPRIRDHAGTPSSGWMCLGDLGRVGSFWNALVAITTDCDSGFGCDRRSNANAHFSKFRNLFT